MLIDGIRGIDELRVGFDYPVSVIAGGNASGKSTVLFAAACAYKVPGAGVRDFVPSTLFPDYRPNLGDRQDGRPRTTIEFQYTTPDGRHAMRWRRAKAWSRSFLGRQGVHQPERPVYLRTLSNLSNPSEVRSVLGMSHLKTAPAELPLTALQIDFAQRMLPFDYDAVVRLSSGVKNLLFAEQAGGAAYSELHMAAGERAILRLAAEIAQLRDALVLIEGILQGIFDDLLPRHRVKRESVRVGRDTGAEEFPAHATAFRKFGQIDSFVFVLDGDKRGSPIASEIQAQAQRQVPVCYLPGGQAPETWVWHRLQGEGQSVLAEALGIEVGELRARMERLDAIFDSASDKPQTIAKTKMQSLADAP